MTIVVKVLEPVDTSLEYEDRVTGEITTIDLRPALRAECDIHKIYSTVPVTVQWLEDKSFIQNVHKRLHGYLKHFGCNCDWPETP